MPESYLSFDSLSVMSLPHPLMMGAYNKAYPSQLHYLLSLLMSWCSLFIMQSVIQICMDFTSGLNYWADSIKLLSPW